MGRPCACCRPVVAWDGGLPDPIFAPDSRRGYTTHWLPGMQSFSTVLFGVNPSDVLANSYRGYQVNTNANDFFLLETTWDDVVEWLTAGGRLLLLLSYRDLYDLDTDTLLTHTTSEYMFTTVNAFAEHIGTAMRFAPIDFYARDYVPITVPFTPGWPIVAGLTTGAIANAGGAITGGQPLIEADYSAFTRPAGTGSVVITAIEQIGQGFVMFCSDYNVLAGDMRLPTSEHSYDDADYADTAEFLRRFFRWTRSQIRGA